MSARQEYVAALYLLQGELSEVLETIQIRKAEQMRYMQLMC
jgi:hypothetical protein